MINSFDELQEKAELLVRLLKEREPGLMTWRAAVAATIKEISWFFPSDVDDEPDVTVTK